MLELNLPFTMISYLACDSFEKKENALKFISQHFYVSTSLFHYVACHLWRSLLFYYVYYTSEVLLFAWIESLVKLGLMDKERETEIVTQAYLFTLHA